jgi:hypothetical protein
MKIFGSLEQLCMKKIIEKKWIESAATTWFMYNAIVHFYKA